MGKGQLYSSSLSFEGAGDRVVSPVDPESFKDIMGGDILIKSSIAPEFAPERLERVCEVEPSAGIKVPFTLLKARGSMLLRRLAPPRGMMEQSTA